MKTTFKPHREARLALFATVIASAAVADGAGLGTRHPSADSPSLQSALASASNGQETNLVVAQATDPKAGHKMPGTPAAAVHKAEGVVRSVGDEITIKHGAIPSLGMGAMTMAYKAPKGGVPKDVKAGTNVKFEFVMTPQGDMQLTSITPGGSGVK